MTNCATKVIEKIGGPKAVADILGVDVSRVYRWTYPKSRGGTGGLIPAKHQSDLLIAARAKGLSLKPSDFFDFAEKDAGEAA